MIITVTRIVDSNNNDNNIYIYIYIYAGDARKNRAKWNLASQWLKITVVENHSGSPASLGPADAEAFSPSPLCQMILSREPLSRTVCGWPGGLLGHWCKSREVVGQDCRLVKPCKSNGFTFQIGSSAPKLGTPVGKLPFWHTFYGSPAALGWSIGLV